MTIYEGMTLFGLMIGMVFVVWSFFVQNKEEQDRNRVELEEFEEYQSRIDEVNQKIIDLNEYGEFLKTELDEKYKELLFLYQLISDKEHQIKSSPQVVSISAPVEQVIVEPTIVESTNQPKNQSGENYNKKIIELYDKGYGEADIAKMLDIGRGQVKLVLNLFK